MMLAEPGIRSRFVDEWRDRTTAWYQRWRNRHVGNLRMSVIEWRAETIQDPLERLRFLRNTVDRGVVAPPRGASHWTRRQMIHAAVAATALVATVTFLALPPASTARPVVAPRPFLMPPPAPQPVGEEAQKVWQVEVTSGFETYSNGLRIEKGYETSANPRVPYPVYSRRDPQLSSSEMRSGPAGIVFHTTESHMAPFEPDQTGQMRRIEASVLDLVSRNHSYHYVIDRFGRVFRIVAESDIANHAGLSIWADEKYAYVNLNNSFLGISFETQTQRDEEPGISPAQIHSARILTDMLRYKYAIPAGNCVTHAQVSVNPSNMRIGYHTDWAGNFPFAEIGLGDNYQEPLASVFAFGFDYDSIFVQSTGRRLWQGLRASDQQVTLQAKVLGIPVPAYKRILRQRYEKILAATRAAAQKGENNEE